jgi:hypothetical protein
MHLVLNLVKETFIINKIMEGTTKGGAYQSMIQYHCEIAGSFSTVCENMLNWIK